MKRAFICCLAVAMLTSQFVLAQSKVVVREIRFEGELGIPESELQEYVEFLKGHALEESRAAKQGVNATRGALGHRGFLRPEVAASLTPEPGATPHKGVVLKMKVNAGRQYRVREITFSGLASEFSSAELGDSIHLRPGDVADANEIDVGTANLNALCKKAGKHCFTIPNARFDEAHGTVSFDLDVEK